jgi:hypothetical protein
MNSYNATNRPISELLLQERWNNVERWIQTEAESGFREFYNAIDKTKKARPATPEEIARLEQMLQQMNMNQNEE